MSYARGYNPTRKHAKQVTHRKSSHKTNQNHPEGAKTAILLRRVDDNFRGLSHLLRNYMMQQLIAYAFLIQSVFASRNTLVRNSIHPQKRACHGHHGNIESMWGHQGLSNIIDAPQSQARVRFGSEEVRTMGQILTPTKVKMQPTVTWPCSCNKFYSVFMIDPDAPCRENPIAGQWYHWGVLNVPGNDIDKGDVITEYFGPTPPKATGLHRYVILVFEQEKKIPVAGITKIGKTAKGRSKWDIKSTAKKYGIKTQPLAGACFQAQWENTVPLR